MVSNFSNNDLGQETPSSNRIVRWGRFIAGVGPTKPIIDTFNELKKIRKPIITVLYKIDYLDEEELETVMTQIEKETGSKAIPIAAKKNIGIEKLNDEIVKVLEGVGKDLLF